MNILNKIFSKNNQFSKKISVLDRVRTIHEMIFCPRCGIGKIYFNEPKEDYSCPICNFSFNKEEYKDFAKIEDLSGILFDFNLGKNNSRFHFDHHGEYSYGSNMTATVRVLEFYKTLNNFDENLTGFKLINKAKQVILNTIQIDSWNKINFYINHIDIDSVLAVFVFRNPQYSLLNEEKIRNLSKLNDLMKLDKEIEIYYYIFYGICSLMENEGKSNTDITNFFIKNFKDIFENPSKYHKFVILEKELVMKSLNVLESCNLNDVLSFLPGFNNKVLGFITPIGFKEIFGLYLFILKPENRMFNLPFIVKKGFDDGIFSLSVNPNSKILDYSLIDLTELKKYLLQAESFKIPEIEKNNEIIRKTKKEYEIEIENIKEELKDHKKYTWFSDLRTLIQKDNYIEFDSLIQNPPKLIDYNFDNLKKYYRDLMQCIYEITDNEKRKLTKKEKKKINDFKSLILEELTDIINELEKDYKNDLNQMGNYIKNVNVKEINYDVEKIWILKSNMVMTNGGYPSNLTYKEFVDVLRKNLHKIVKL